MLDMYENNMKRWVYGTRTKKWYLVGPDDSDFRRGISKVFMSKYGKEISKEKYLRVRFL
jgi:hypothetical protein